MLQKMSGWVRNTRYKMIYVAGIVPRRESTTLGKKEPIMVTDGLDAC